MSMHRESPLLDLAHKAQDQAALAARVAGIYAELLELVTEPYSQRGPGWGMCVTHQLKTLRKLHPGSTVLALPAFADMIEVAP